ncbi:FimV/HubP family polar landmark protein [Lentisalinibacter orientalis]|uniref:FimV/HubP family polar landmark protein n=1 Tax=Lentisalinibacter orientalis TaxID=2992241 RepID=UPI00386C7085
MLGRLAGATLILLLAWSGTAQALGLGDIRLESALNEPFRAEIELLSVTPEELEGLTVQLAATDTFRRYGIDRPPFLSGFRFDVRRLPGDRGVVRITSSEPVTEPFVTFLAEAVWPRGRLLREYTVLLDPPTFASEESTEQAAPVRAPAAPAQRSADAGSIRRAPEPRQTSPGLDAGDTYRVPRNETLWGIAQRVRPSGLTINQVMVALYENNPEAFDGNINRLREGAVLRIPSEDAMYGINRSEAVAEVSRQNQAWQGGESGSLRLVPPDEAPATAAAPTPGSGAGTSGTAAGTSAAEAERLRRLESELAERERLLAIKDQELARLREQLASREDAAETPPAAAGDEAVTAAPGVDLEAEGEAAADAGGDEIFAEDEPEAESDLEAEPGTGAQADETAAEAEQPAAREPAPARTTPAVVTTGREDEGGIMGLLGGLLGSIWTYVGLGVVVIALLLLVLARRRGGEVEDSTGTWEALDDDFEDDEEREATERLRALASDDDSILVVEKEETSGTGAAAALAGAGAGAAAAAAGAAARADEQPDTGASGSYSLEDTFSSETAINLDQSDPLAEADFHMAYGLYDQAADLMRNAIAADPDRTDLKAKLAEVYFVWGNKDAFVDAAENLHDALGGAAGEKDSDWDKIVIMGQQIAPDHELFAGAAAAGGGDVDLSFDEESGVGTLDVDFGADEEGGVDLAFGDEDSGEADLEGTSGGLDFVLDETGERTGTNEMLLDPADLAETGEYGQYEASDDSLGGEEPTQESPTLETPYEEDTQESPTLETPFEEEDTRESPTVETPAGAAADADDEVTQETPTIETWGLGEGLGEDETTELPAASEEEQRRSEQTAEIDLDDLGLDLDGLEESGERSATVLQFQEDVGESDDDLLDRTGETQVLGDDDATMLAPGAAGADEPVGRGDRGDEPGDDDATTLAPAADRDFAETEALDERDDDDDTGATGRMPRLGGEDVDVDLDDLTAAIRQGDLGDLETPRDEDDTVEQPTSTDATGRFSSEVFDDDELDSILDLDVGEDLSDEDDAPTETGMQETGEGRTQTEVGTKLDLARAYVDMGDPEGARSILQEVLEEGDEGQRQEANRLLDALPD